MANAWQPWLLGLSILFLLGGATWALLFVPPDYQQGHSVRIMYIHVPAAILAQSGYVMMAVAAIVFLVWRIKLADMATRVEAARLLVEQAAAKFDRGERCDMEAGMAKLFASEAALENATEAMRVHGGYGYSEEFDVERYYRDAPLLCIGEGTNEIQRVLISRQLIKRNPV